MMGKNMQEKLRKLKRLIAVILCVIMATGTGVSSLAELGPLNIWIPLASDSNATAITDDEMEGSRVIVASWSDATLSDATASNAVNWQAQLQARIDALPSIQEIREDDTNELLVNTYWEVLDIMDILNDQIGVALYDSIMDADDGSIEGADELDVSRLYEIADYVMKAYTMLGMSQQMQALSFVADDEVITIEPDGLEGDNQAILTLQVTGNPTTVSYTSQEADGNHTNDYYSYLTGETLELTYEISGGYPEDYVYRIYFKPTDASGIYTDLPGTGTLADGIADQVKFYLNSDDEVELGNYSAPLVWDKEEEAWYVQFSDIHQENTGGGTLQITYPSPTTPGGDLWIYGVICDAKAENIVSNTWDAFDANWKTAREEFEVHLDLDETQEAAGLILSLGEDGKTTHVAVKDEPDQDIIYTISMEKTVDSLADEGIGEDLISYIEVTDTIQLPAGIKLNAEVFPEPTITESGDEQYITFTSGGTVLELVNRSGNAAEDYSFDGYNTETNTITVTWKIVNGTSDGQTGFVSSQIEDGVWEVRLNGEYLLVDDWDAFNGAEKHEIVHTVSYDYYYTWSKMRTSEAVETIEIAEPSSNVVLDKTTDRSDTVYMGSDAYYTISLYNQGVSKTTNLLALEDTALDTKQYITPENIWKMFIGDEDDLKADPYLASDSGDYLTLTITDAWVYYSSPQTLTQVADMKGELTVYETNANHYFANTRETPEHENATITMVKDGNSIVVTFKDGEDPFYGPVSVSNAEDLEMLLLQMGYVVTASAQYSAVWDLSGCQLAGGETRHYKVYSSMKGTFQYWENVYLNEASSYQTADNTVYLKYDNTDKSEGDEGYHETNDKTAEYTNIMTDFTLTKKVSEIDGEQVTDAEVDVFYRGSVITYELLVRHFGDGVAKDIPLVDIITGSQYLLAPVNAENSESIEKGTFADEPYVIDYGEDSYYVLDSSGTCYNLWLDGTHCAAEVYVDASKDNSRGSYSMTYEITWNYDGFSAPEDDSLTYKTLINSNTTTVTDAQNIAYLNGRYEGTSDARKSALKDQIDSTEIKSGSLKKRILTSDASADGDEEKESYAVTSVLDLNSDNSYETTIRYKLELNAKSGNSLLTFTDVKDILPYTYGEFVWKEDQISVTYRYASAIKDEDEKEVTPNPPYELRYTDAEGNEVLPNGQGEYLLKNGDAAYQTIYWGTVELPKDAEGLWFYVDLKFDMDSESWLKYADKVSGNLKNTFSAVIDENGTPDTADVLHSVKKDAKAYLQKGVYWINTPSEDGGSYVSATDSREIYYNSTVYDDDGNLTEGSLVAYYIQIYNPSSSYLYLREIQDLVPDGFSLKYLYGSTSDYQDGSRVDVSVDQAAATSAVSPASALDGKDVTGVENAPTFVAANVKAETGSDGIVRYTIYGGNLKTDDDLGDDYYYLAQGEAVSFIAEFEVGSVSETETYATNTIAMPYLNLSGGDLSVADVSGTAVAADSSKEVEQNVGGCSILDETEREVEGFQSEATDVGEISQWLSSNVTVRRGEIIPGINKTLVTDDTGGVYGSDPVTWQIDVTNDGTVPMKNYAISDIVDSPYLILGDVTYEIYNNKDNCILRMYNDGRYDSNGSSYPFFSVARTDSSTHTITWYQGARRPTAKSSTDQSAEIYPAIEIYSQGAWAEMGTSNVLVVVKIDKDGNGDDRISIDFADSVFAIPEGGRGVLTIQTKTLDGVSATSDTYYNLARITPTQSYKDELVTIGEAVSVEEGLPYVKSSDQIHVSNGYSTSAQKWIQSNDDLSKIARSEKVNANGVHYINLDSEAETFRYTLEVTNNLTSSMTDLIIVDALPQSGDYAPFAKQNEKTARESEFQIDLMEGDEQIWSVIKGTKLPESGDEDLAALQTITGTKDIDEDKYTIHYSTCTYFGLGLNDDSLWALDSKDDDGNLVWTDDPKGARAVRIEITDSIARQEAVQVSFNARISADSADDIAEPGEISWNSFAYQYTTMSTESEENGNVGTAQTKTLWAAPRKVGVQIPSLPKLTKELSGVDADDNIEDQTFRFLVHEGPQLSSVTYSDSDVESNLITALGNESPALGYFITEVTVSGGTAAEVALNPNGAFTYVNGNEYTVVELPNSSSKPGNDQFVAQYMSYGSQTVQGNAITFTYSGSSTVSVSASNKAIEWALKLLKVDEDTSDPIAGVVFGLYSSTKPADGVYDSLVAAYGELLTTPSDASKITIEGESGNWYLIDVKTTDDDGNILWTGMTDSVYYLKELKAADGYSLLTDLIKIDYWNPDEVQNYEQSKDGTYKIVTKTITNKAGYILPKTGGHGTLWIQLLGLLLMSMGVSLTYITKRKITSLRRTK